MQSQLISWDYYEVQREKIDISIEIKLLFAVSEFKPDGFGSYIGYAVNLSFSFRPQLLLWLSSKYSWALSHWFSLRFLSNLQYNLQNIQIFITEAYG